MHNQPLFSSGFGVHPVALAVAYLLGTTEYLEGGEGKDEVTRQMIEEVIIETFVIHNGREHGLCIRVKLGSLALRKAYHFNFGEHRNSDAIFIDTWTCEAEYNGATREGCTEEDYNRRVFFKYNQVREAAAHMHNAIQAAILTLHREADDLMASHALAE